MPQNYSDQLKARRKLKPHELMVVKVDDHGKKYVEVLLTQNKKALIDYMDYKVVSKHKWHTHKSSDILYAGTNLYSKEKNRNQTKILMHSLILGENLIDHKNGNGLDNRRSNIRACTISQNRANSSKAKGTSSKYKGVFWRDADKKWFAQTSKNHKRYYIGKFENASDAAKAYDNFARKLYGDFAKLNFPDFEYCAKAAKKGGKG